MLSRFQVLALGVPLDIELNGFSDSDITIVTGAWSRARPGRPVPSATTISTQPPALGSLSSRVTRAAIEMVQHSLLVLHAGAVADPSGKTIAMIGHGVTTACIALGAPYGYVSDETIGIGPDLRVMPLAKPLSVVVDGSRRKKEASPDALALGVAPERLRLHRIVLLDQRPDAPESPIVQPIEFADAIVDLLASSSSLHDLDDGLQRMSLASAGLVRVTYREASDLGAVFARLFESPPPVAEEWKTASPVAAGGGMRRAPYADAITDGRRVIVLHNESARVIDGVGSTVWLASVGIDMNEIVKIVAARHGQPPTGSVADHVEEAVAQLVDAGVILLPS